MAVLRRVLAQRREHDAVLQRQATELQWPEQLGHIFLALAIGDQRSAGWRIL